MTDALRVGVLGGGGILWAHGPGLMAQAGRCEVVAVAEPDATRHERVRSLLGRDVRIVADYRDVLAMPEVNAVDVLLPHSLHMPATVEAARAAKHVLVEKVMARNVYECDRMLEACDAAGVTLTVSHDRRYSGPWRALKDIVDSGHLGEPFYWKLEHNQDVLFPPDTWVRSRDGLGGGAIMSCLTHQIDALRWYGGEVESVMCMGRVLPERMEGETVGLIGARMKSGALAQLSINWCTKSHLGPHALPYELVQVCGTRGEAYHRSGHGTFVLLRDPADAAAIDRWGPAVTDGFVPVPCGDEGGHGRCIAEWVSMLRGEPSCVVTSGREVRGTVEVAEAAYLAEATARTVTLPIEPVPWGTAR